MRMNALQRLRHAIEASEVETHLLERGGLVSAINPNVIAAEGMAGYSALGDFVLIGEGADATRGEIVQIEPDRIVVAPCENARALSINDVVLHKGPVHARPDESWLGRVVNAVGEPVDGKGPLIPSQSARPVSSRRSPLMRARIGEHFRTGVRVIDIFTPLCMGQRFGVFAGSGVGKSTLLAMLAKAGAFDVVVVSLVGERSREVREFLEDTLGAGRHAQGGRRRGDQR